jgi:hypothetical protein
LGRKGCPGNISTTGEDSNLAGANDKKFAPAIVFSFYDQFYSDGINNKTKETQ